MNLTGNIVPVSAINETLQKQLFGLYQRFYAPTDEAVFRRDLAGKTYCVTLTDKSGNLCGFSSVAQLPLNLADCPAIVLFSGDTVVDRPFWGEQTLPFTWIEQAGRIKATFPDLPLYWLLISKGHRTYRYLSAFAQHYHPQPRIDATLRARANEVAAQMFGERYHEDRGVLLADPDCPTALRPEFHGLDAVRLSNPHIRYFLEQNPGHAAGEELLCLCELSADNLRPRARRQFLKGMG